MISNTPVNANSFVCCSVYQSPNETTTYFNDNNGHYHSHIYMIEGLMTAYESATEIPSELDLAVKLQMVQGTLYDVRHTKGKFVTAKTGQHGAAMVMFNPIPADKSLNIEILNGKQTVEIHATTQRITVVCLTGPVNVNGKELKSTQFAVVFQDKSAILNMEDNTICALVTS
jgi:hypothetical protein